jgi:hypothetical protein
MARRLPALTKDLQPYLTLERRRRRTFGQVCGAVIHQWQKWQKPFECFAIFAIAKIKHQQFHNKNFSKNQISDYISAILKSISRAPKFCRMIDYFMDFVNNLVRMRKVIYLRH